MVGSANRVSMAPNNAGFAAPLQAGRGSLGVWGLASMLLLLTAACGPKAAGDEHHEKTPDELLADACASFCERALACPLGDYAKTLDFQDQQTCVPQCVEFHSWFPSDPPEECLLIRTELWTCAGALETCELFDAFETTSFGAPHPSGNPCAHELDSFLAKCNG